MAGLFVAFSLLGAWFLALALALSQVHLSTMADMLSYAWLSLIIQWLYVGLFITVHDACHGSVAPGKPRLNLWIGRVFAFLYAGLNFDQLQRKHARHHLFSGTLADPDFHAPEKASFIFWHFRFFRQYITVWPILIMCAIAQILMHGLHIAKMNVFIFWVAPSLLSSLQLFYFGTYLPHLEAKKIDFSDHHRARNFAVPFVGSLISCYHFGAFHHRHHQMPALPWFKLPKV